MTTEYYHKCDFLGFDLDGFVKSALDSGERKSSYFPILSDVERSELMAYLVSKGYNILLRSGPRGAYLVTPFAVHQAVSSAFNDLCRNLNTQITGTKFRPLAACGTADVVVNGSVNQPDASLQVAHRNSKSVNIVQESHHRVARNTVAEICAFHDRLKAYITGTDGVMLAVGFVIYEPMYGTNDFAAIACLYERDARNNPQLVQNISFGTIPVAPDELVLWNVDIEQAPLSGIGMICYPRCNEANRANPAFQLRLRQSHVLCTNTMFPFTYNLNQGPIDDFLT